MFTEFLVQKGDAESGGNYCCCCCKCCGSKKCLLVFLIGPTLLGALSMCAWGSIRFSKDYPFMYKFLDSVAVAAQMGTCLYVTEVSFWMVPRFGYCYEWCFIPMLVYLIISRVLDLFLSTTIFVNLRYATWIYWTA